MIAEAILLTTLIALIALAVRNGHTLPSPQPASVIALTPVDGALRVTRARLEQGEIDIAEYRRICAALHG